MNKILLIITMLLFFAVASAQAWEDPFKNQNSGDQEKLRYNPYENKWSYEKPDSQLRHNPYERKWEYTEPGEQLKYNPYENKWEHAR